jgi:hypothetical protein
MNNKLDYIIQNYLKNKFYNLQEAKEWLLYWAANEDQSIKCNQNKIRYITVNLMIMHISNILGHKVDNAFKSKYYWDLRDYYENNITY